MVSWTRCTSHTVARSRMSLRQSEFSVRMVNCLYKYRSADKSLARPGRKQARKHVRDARYFNNIETRAVIMFLFFLQGKAPKEIHAILTETLACFLPGRAKDLSAPLYVKGRPLWIETWTHWNPIRRCTTTPPLVLSPSSFLLPFLSHCPSFLQIMQLCVA